MACLSCFTMARTRGTAPKLEMKRATSSRSCRRSRREEKEVQKSKVSAALVAREMGEHPASGPGRLGQQQESS